jgi:DNA invertase Pin-like site-specific DNA recombinase
MDETSTAGQALSGATLQRPGLQRLIRFVQGQQIDVVVAEGIDRISRSMSDMSILFDLFVNANIRLLTLHEGEVSDLHVGMKGTMNKVFLKDLKERIRRGQAGRTKQGFVMGKAPFGYRTVFGLFDLNGQPQAGVKEIDPVTAQVVKDIFQMYADGLSASAITREMNGRGISRPRAKNWSESHVRSILENRFYTGEVSYRKTTNYRDPLTGKVRVKKLPPSEWIVTQNEALRIISDTLWRQVQARRAKLVPPTPRTPKKDFASHQRVLTDYVFCGACGKVKHVANRGRYVCAGNRYDKTCTNARGTNESDARAVLFEALLKVAAKLPPLRPTILQAYEEDIRRRHDLDRREAETQEKIDRLMQAIEDGIDYRQSVERIKALQAEKARLKEAKAFEVIPTIGTEEEITAKIIRTLDLLRTETEREPVREMLAVIRPRIVMTPIPDRYRGETIAIELPDTPEPWARFWISLQR